METNEKTNIGLFKVLGSLAFATYVITALGDTGIRWVLAAIAFTVGARLIQMFWIKDL